MTNQQIRQTAADMIEAYDGDSTAARAAAWTTCDELAALGEPACEDWRGVVQAIDVLAA